VLIAGSSCERRPTDPAPRAEPGQKDAPARVAPAPALPPPSAPPAPPAPPAATRDAAQTALARLEEALRPAAGDPETPWALAHGLLAFGKDYRARDGRSAVLVAASFAEPRVAEDGRTTRYGFAAARDGKPVEPHPYLLVKTFLEIGVPSDLSFRAADGAAIGVRRLLSDMRASVRAPQSDAQWHDAAWWLTALELDRAAKPEDRAPLRAAALARLEADDAVIAAHADDPFHPSAPMGAAKRNKTHIYGHPCGGLHFVQAVLRGAVASGSADSLARAARQLRLLVRRHEAERALYAATLRGHPAARLLVSSQQLKFFGHLLETLALAEELGVARDDPDLRAAVTGARRQAAADLLETLHQLDAERAYARLPELAAERPQLHLDLIGDGCHAVHGLRATLPVLPP
jgi:hypothetical protein